MNIAHQLQIDTDDPCCVCGFGGSVDEVHYHIVEAYALRIAEALERIADELKRMGNDGGFGT